MTFSHGRLFANIQTGNESPAADYSIQKDPKPLTKAPSTSSITPPPSSESQNVSDPATANADSGNGQTAPIIKDTKGINSCAEDINDAVKSYNRDVQKQKDVLDNQLSFIVGINISSQYVSDYNNKVTNVFNEYLNEAKSEHCNWPVKEPALLPLTYTL